MIILSCEDNEFISIFILYQKWPLRHSKFEKVAMAVARCIATKLESSPYDNDKGMSILPKYNFKNLFSFSVC